MWRKTTQWILQATNCGDFIREHPEMANKRKPQEISGQAVYNSTK